MHPLVVVRGEKASLRYKSREAPDISGTQGEEGGETQTLTYGCECHSQKQLGGSSRLSDLTPTTRDLLF
jgi:hypothetical protein